MQWVEELAGCEVKCRCGQPLKYPSARPGLKRNVYDVVNDTTDLEPPAAKVLKPPPVLPYRAQAPQFSTAKHEMILEAPVKPIVILATLIVLGVAIRLVLAALGPSGLALGSWLAVILSIPVGVVSMLAGVVLVGRMMGSDLGNPIVAVLKLTVVAIVGNIIFAGGIAMDNGDGVNGMMIAAHAVLLVYWLIIWKWFDLDLQESLFCVAMVALLQACLACALWPR